MTMKNIENEILILDHSLDKNLIMTTSYSSSSDDALINSNNDMGRLNCEKVKAQKEHSLEDAKRIHEDLEFQLMELEAKYETELEDIQNRLIKEQDSLLSAFKQRQSNLNEYDQQQTQMLMQVKAETECLELERQKLIEKFKKQRAQLQLVEQKLAKLQEEQKLQNEPSSDEAPPLKKSPTIEFAPHQNHHQTNAANQENQRTPSPASSSVSISSSANTSSDTTPPIQPKSAQIVF